MLAHSALLALGPVGLAELFLVSLIAGIGITAVGPGGVLMTIGLFALTPLSPAAVAGTAIVTHIGTGLVGTAAFLRSGQLRRRDVRRLALILGGSTLAGIPIGIAVNAQVSRQGFGLLLGLFAAVIGVLVWRRQRQAAPAQGRAPEGALGLLPAVAVGLGVAAASSLFGLGGPMVAVPLLVLLHVPLLAALAAAQAQSVVVAGTGTIGYALAGTIDWPVAAFIVVPQVAGVLIGWKIAHSVPTRGLGYALGGILIALAPYLALRGG